MATQQNLCFIKEFKNFELKCILNKESLIITGKLKAQKLIFGTSLKPGKMPSSCTNIFDYPSELYFYLQKQKEDNIHVENNTMKVNVHLQHLGKSKAIEIPLQTKNFGKEEMLEMDVESMKERIEKLEKIIEQLAPAQLSKLYEHNIIQKMDSLESRLQKLEAKTPIEIDSLQRQAEHDKRREQPIKQSELHKKKSQNSSADPLTKLNLIKQKQQHQVHPFNVPINRDNSKEKDGSGLGSELFLRNFKFEIDLSNKNLDNFIVKNDLVTKKIEDGKLYQVYCLNAIPDRYRYRATFKFNVLSPEEVAFGLITEDKKHLQYIYQQSGTISMGCDQGYELYVDGRPQEQYLRKIKYGYVMEMDVEVKSRKVRFFRQGDHHSPVAKTTIPETMCNKKLYVFFQIKNEGDSVQLMQV